MCVSRLILAYTLLINKTHCMNTYITIKSHSSGAFSGFKHLFYNHLSFYQCCVCIHFWCCNRRIAVWNCYDWPVTISTLCMSPGGGQADPEPAEGQQFPLRLPRWGGVSPHEPGGEGPPAERSLQRRGLHRGGRSLVRQKGKGATVSQPLMPVPKIRCYQFCEMLSPYHVWRKN